MLKADLQEAIREAERFIRVSQEALAANPVAEFQKRDRAVSAVRRASADLSRKLADLRKSKPLPL